MSFTPVPATRPRLNRSQLAVPGSNLKFIEKARNIPADIIMFDLEDAVAPDEKEQARRNVIQAIRDLDWRERTLSVRINGLDTPFMYRDLIEVAEQAGDRLDLIMVPKIGTGADVYAVDVLLTQIRVGERPDETNRRRADDRIGARDAQHRRDRRRQRQDRVAALRLGRFRRLDRRPNAQHRRSAFRLPRARRRRRDRRQSHLLERHVALSADADGRCRPRARTAADRRPIRGLPG